MAFAVTRENLLYIAWGKQAGVGTSATPTQFWRWLDGTEGNPEAKTQTEREGDSSPFAILAYKTGQHWTIKIKEKLRPITAGCALQAVMGTGGDTYTAPTKSSTLSAPIVAGASTFVSVGDLGNASTAYLGFTPGYSSATYEVQNVNLASRSGTGPYTYTLVSGTFANAHNTADVVNNGATHVFQRQQFTYDYYTIEVGFMTGGGFTGKAFRIQDCVCHDWKITGTAGRALEIEHGWYGTFATIQAGLLTPAFETGNIVGAPGGPMSFYGGSSWTLDGATTNNATSVTNFDINIKNSTGPEDGQSELLNPSFFIPGNVDISANVEFHFQTYNQYLNTYFGSPTAPATTTDSYLMGYGAFLVQINGDGPAIAANALDFLRLNLPNVAYTTAPIMPKLDGKPLKQKVAMTAIKSAGAPNPVILTLGNGQTSQY